MAWDPSELGRPARLRQSGRGTAAKWLGLAAGVCALLVLACTPGTYPLDIFPEMHYQPSQRRLEPDRLTAPAEAVPVTGRAPALTFEQAANLVNPLEPSPASLERARLIYHVNCAMCHGPDGRGQSTVAAYYAQNPYATVPPTDLASARVQDRTDGQLYWIVSNGLGNMPPFRQLLTDEDRWAALLFIRNLPG